MRRRCDSGPGNPGCPSRGSAFPTIRPNSLRRRCCRAMASGRTLNESRRAESLPRRLSSSRREHGNGAGRPRMGVRPRFQNPPKVLQKPSLKRICGGICRCATASGVRLRRRSRSVAEDKQAENGARGDFVRDSRRRQLRAGFSWCETESAVTTFAAPCVLDKPRTCIRG